MTTTTLASLTLSEAIDKIELRALEKGLAANTIDAYEADTKQFWTDSRIVQLYPAGAETLAIAWLSRSKADERIAPSTTRRRLSSMKFLCRAIGASTTMLTEWKPPTLTVPPPHPLPGGMDDVRAIFAAATTSEERALIMLLSACGLRISEARSIRVSHFWPDSTTGGTTLTVRGKGDKTRYIPVPSKAWAVLLPRCLEVMTTAQGDPFLIELSDRGARQVIARLARKAGVSRQVASHDLRMTYGTELLRGGTNIRVVQDLLGHASVATTERYTGTTEVEKRAAVEGLL